MDLDDIESHFNSCMKTYKSGKYIVIRCYIPNNKVIKKNYCLIYDENENILPITDIKDSNIIIPILEVLGIKFSARNFQLELIGKQIMVLNNKPLFNSCLIKRNTNLMTHNKEQKDLEKIILCDVPTKIYPELENAFLNLIHNSGHPGIKLEKKIDFNKLYNERFN